MGNQFISRLHEVDCGHIIEFGPENVDCSMWMLFLDPTSSGSWELFYFFSLSIDYRRSRPYLLIIVGLVVIFRLHKVNVP